MRTDLLSPRPQRRGRTVAAITTVLSTVTAATLLALNAAPATGETPEERCQRETAAYNAAWESTWRASHPTDPGPPPPPPVPYTCHDPATPTTTTTPPPPTAPGLAPTQSPGGGIQGRSGNAPGQLSPGNGTDIVPGPATATGPVTPIRPTDAPAMPPPSTVPARTEPKDIAGSACGVDWHGPPCAEIQDCPPGYALVDDQLHGQVCFQVELVDPSYGDRSQISGGHTTGSLPIDYHETVSDTATDAVSGSITRTDGTTQTVGGSVEVGAKGSASIPLLADAEASTKVTGSYSWAGTSQQAETTGQSSQYSRTVSKDITAKIPPCTQFTVTPEYALLHWRMAQRYSWTPMGEGDMTHATGRMKTFTDPIPESRCNK